MKQIITTLLIIGLLTAGMAGAASVLKIRQGGTGLSTSTTGSMLYYDSDSSSAAFQTFYCANDEIVKWSAGLPACGTATGSPGGSDTQVQFNNSGSFGGSGEFTYDSATFTVSMNNFTVNGISMASDGTVLTIGSNIDITDSYEFRLGDITFASGGDGAYQLGIYDQNVGDVAFLDVSLISTDRTFKFPDIAGSTELGAIFMTASGSNSHLNIGSYSFIGDSMILSDSPTIGAVTYTGTDGSAAGQVLTTDGAGSTFFATAAAAFDATTIDAETWSDGANASNAWTFDVSGTDPVLTFGSALFDMDGMLTVDSVGIFDTTPDAALEVVSNQDDYFMISRDADGDGNILLVDSAGDMTLGSGTDKDAVVSMNDVVFMGIDISDESTFKFANELDFATPIFEFSSGAVFGIYNGTQPTASITDGILLFASDGGGGTSELYVRDEAGNITTLSPHDSYGEWVFWSENQQTGKSLTVYMEQMAKFLDNQFGTNFVIETQDGKTLKEENAFLINRIDDLERRIELLEQKCLR
jgi:hypothetical protein